MDSIALMSFMPIFVQITKVKLTRSEQTEIMRVAQGWTLEASAQAMGLSIETIRARRKHIYKKFKVTGAHELVALLFAESLDLLMRGKVLKVELPDLNDHATRAK